MIDSLVETLVMILSVKPMSASSAGTKQPARSTSTSARAHLTGGYIAELNVCTSPKSA